MNHPPNTWSAVSDLLDLAMRSLPAAKPAWRNESLEMESPEQIEWALESCEAPHEEEIEWAINEFLKGSGWPAVSENSAFLLRLRCEQGANFAFYHQRPKSDESLFPFNGSVQAMASFLLTEWWHIHGRSLEAGDIFATGRFRD